MAEVGLRELRQNAREGVRRVEAPGATGLGDDLSGLDSGVQDPLAP